MAQEIVQPAGVGALSGLKIDVDKDWKNHDIKNMFAEGQDLSAHSARHAPGGADPTNDYIQGASTGKLAEGGTVSGDDAKSTYSYAVALSAVDNVSSALHTQNGAQPGDTRLNNVGTSSTDIGYPDPGNAAESHTTETMGLTVIGDA